jgi:hypothetical protein
MSELSFGGSNMRMAINLLQEFSGNYKTYIACFVATAVLWILLVSDSSGIPRGLEFIPNLALRTGATLSVLIPFSIYVLICLVFVRRQAIFIRKPRGKMTDSDKKGDST